MGPLKPMEMEVQERQRSESTKTETPSSNIDKEKIDRAQSVSFEATEDPEFVRPPNTEKAGVKPENDPALDGIGERPLDVKQEEWQNFLTPVFEATDTTLQIFYDDWPGLDPGEAKQLGEVWGDVAGHFVDIKDGGVKGDIARAGGESFAIASDKLKKIKEKKDGQKHNNSSGENT